MVYHRLHTKFSVFMSSESFTHRQWPENLPLCRHCTDGALHEPAVVGKEIVVCQQSVTTFRMQIFYEPSAGLVGEHVQPDSMREMMEVANPRSPSDEIVVERTATPCTSSKTEVRHTKRRGM
jgi:hypothetical protein